MKKYLLIFFVIFTLPVCAQKTHNVKGEYTYYAPENVTPEQAKRTALENAKLMALADEFGTSMSEDVRSGGKVINGKSEEYFFSQGSSEVKGEWIETTDEPEYDIRYEGGQLIVTCRVKGKAREIVNAAIDFKAKVLCNGKEDKFESTQFKNEDDLYLSFQSPVNGYLAVYLEDGEGLVYCLLPYRAQKDGIYPIEANRHYLFFDPKSAPAGEQALVDEYFLTCNGSTEYNQIYIIFSPNQFTKASDSDKSVQDGLTLPRQLPREDFYKWLAKCRKHDVGMNVKKVGVTVEKNNKHIAN